MATTIHYRFLVRGGTAADLAAVNEVPKARELVVETDTRKLKLGDGATAYNDLEYITGGSGGAPVEFQASATHIQWRLVGDPTWIDLVPLADLKGDPGDPGTPGTPGTDGEDGREVELGTDATHVRWRYVGEAWTNLVALADLKGDQGDPGPDGPAGGPSPVTSISGNTVLDHTAHAGRWIEVTAAAVITLPATGSTDWNVGDFAELCQASATAFTVVAGAGATIAPHTALLIDASRYQGGVVVVKLIASNTWRVAGALADAP